MTDRQVDTEPGHKPLELRGAVAVVTGGAGGIGRALAERLAAEDARIALVDLDESRAQEAARSCGAAIGIGADVGDEAAVRDMVARVEAELGPVELYLSNAGVGGGVELGDDRAWELSWRVHAMAHVYAARAVLPGMAARGSGAMVITASAAGLLMMMQSAPYTVTKHASVAIAEWLAVEYGDKGVQLHCLCPQGVRTPMVSADPRGESEVAASGRILEPSEVAEAVVDAVRTNRFLVLPHPEVHAYEQRKAADRNRWL
ncbi:MAG: SDR family oxidoreductase, partial [Acidimicrobiales bacterium]